ncbi:hypothetical protein HIM_00860 [Hirsutella minnesotensis 3608]|nr:hypothetical protein HIM_00860 [Hirsutella minnesotensis 3608]
MAATLKTLAMRWPPQPSLVRCCSKPSMSTAFTQMPLRQRPFSQCARAFPPSNSLAPRSNATFQPARASSGVRCFASSAPRSSASTSSSSTPLDWNSFFTLRLRRRRIQVAISLATGALGGGAGAVLLSTGLAEPLVAQVPLDPFFTLGLMTLACAGIGWLVGPSIGSQVFYLLNRRLKPQMLKKEAEFFARIKKHRADPTNSSAGNPVPDFYGEKIQSVAGYRRWLKDQRAFNRKKTANFV